MSSRENQAGIFHCKHSSNGLRGRLALVTIGNTLRGDDGAAQAVCNVLRETVAARVCRFDLGTYTNLLPLCLAGHDAAIILDAVATGGTPGSLTILDLTDPARACSAGNISATHALSLADELQIAGIAGCLPRKTLFFGIEVQDAGWGKGLSEALRSRLPDLAGELERLIEMCA
ncbi:MAG TPA: hydrogenase maturation protease [Candidatus Obscuribacterales bacterium]